ncbi:MAG: HAMP domain-containing sensor histidine kinase, partial [Clostridia bacterium]|nr:HAMP domain-containing sensor histidine kinase [Clostridia bacterium]
MSHDIRTPMNVVVGMTEIARRHIDEKERVEDCLNKINMESIHLQTLINDVLDISAIESGKLTIKPEEIRVKDIVENMKVSVQSLVHSKAVDFEYRQGNIFFPYINADSLRISQVYLNLLSNALKYT